MAYNRLKDLLQQRADLTSAMDTMLQAAENGTTPLDQSAFDDRKAELERVVKLLRTAQEEQERDRAVAASRVPEQGGAGEPGAPVDSMRLQHSAPYAGRHYHELFGAIRRPSLFSSTEEFLTVVHSGLADQRLIQANMTEGAPAGGGYSVPEELSVSFWDRSLQMEIIRPRATVVAMNSSTRTVAMPEDSDHGAAAGGPFHLGLSRADEGATLTTREAKLRLVRLNAKKAGVVVPVSNELLEDSPVGQQLDRALLASFSAGLDYAFVNGNGSGMPSGVLASPSLITVAKEPGQVNGSLVFENVASAYSRLLPACVSTSIWIASPSVIPSLLTLTVGVGAAPGVNGTHYPVLNEQNGAWYLLGRPLFLTSACATLGTKGDLVLFDPSLYLVGIRREITVDKSSHLGFAQDISHIRATVRLDAQGLLDVPFQPLQGPTQSWAVCIATR